MVKRFLVDLYINWRTLEGLPVVEEYAVAKLGMTHHFNTQERAALLKSPVVVDIAAAESSKTPTAYRVNRKGKDNPNQESLI